MDYIQFKEKANQNIMAAQSCFDSGWYDACCNRAYYGMYHAAIAALSQEGIMPTTETIKHDWVQRHFVTYFCNRHKIFPHFRRFLVEAQQVRDTADYKTRLLNQRTAKQQLTRATDFVQSILRRLETYDEF